MLYSLLFHVGGAARAPGRVYLAVSHHSHIAKRSSAIWVQFHLANGTGTRYEPTMLLALQYHIEKALSCKGVSSLRSARLASAPCHSANSAIRAPTEFRQANLFTDNGHQGLIDLHANAKMKRVTVLFIVSYHMLVTSDTPSNVFSSYRAIKYPNEKEKQTGR